MAGKYFDPTLKRFVDFEEPAPSPRGPGPLSDAENFTTEAEKWNAQLERRARVLGIEVPEILKKHDEFDLVERPRPPQRSLGKRSSAKAEYWTRELEKGEDVDWPGVLDRLQHRDPRSARFLRKLLEGRKKR
ncbi:MAG TPA: hypothetical protein VGF61_13085 [Candidatus Acidoferrum sp.]|jgi:hypothetical protein